MVASWDHISVVLEPVVSRDTVTLAVTASRTLSEHPRGVPGLLSLRGRRGARPPRRHAPPQHPRATSLVGHGRAERGAGRMQVAERLRVGAEHAAFAVGEVPL